MPSLLDPVQHWAGTTPDAVALRDQGRGLSYAALLDAARRFAAVLGERGTRRGDRVLLLAPAVPEFVVAYLAIQAAGAVLVPMNTVATKDEITYVLEDSGAGCVLAWHELGDASREAARASSVQWHALPERVWQDLGDVSPAAVVAKPPEETAAILYTSGTTGRPKGAVISVANILTSAVISNRISDGTPADRIGTALPLFHIFGQISVMMSALTCGGSLSLVSPFTPASMLDRIRDDQLTVIAGVPTMWNAMLAARTDHAPEDLQHVRLAVSGGAALPGKVAREFEDRFACRLLEGYGLTETTSLGTLHRGGKPGSVGRPVPETQVELRDDSGAPVPAGEVGEVHITGPTVMQGYWNRPQETAAVLSDDGWLRTGDLGRFDEDGDLFIVDRLKDLVIRGGYNVYPAEVEGVLYDHPEVVEAAVVGVPHEHFGEEIAAVVVLRSGSTLAAEDVVAWARARLSAYKVPRIVRFTDELPKGASGKILKRAIDRTSLL